MSPKREPHLSRAELQNLRHELADQAEVEADRALRGLPNRHIASRTLLRVVDELLDRRRADEVRDLIEEHEEPISESEALQRLVYATMENFGGVRCCSSLRTLKQCGWNVAITHSDFAHLALEVVNPEGKKLELRATSPQKENGP